LSLSENPLEQPSIQTGCASNLPFATGSFEAAIGSPPYATRIDYVRSVLPELAVLGARPEEVATLRSVSTGSPVIRGTKLAGDLQSATGLTLLERVRFHGSKGSEKYYYPWLTKYLVSLQAGLSDLIRVVSTNGPICIIVQDSHYKELHIDLQQIVTEMMNANDKRLESRSNYAVKHHKARMNPRARRHLSDRKNSESLLIFR
jgi:hypothetical protein